MATPVLTVLEEDRHAWFAGRTRAILAALDATMGAGKNGAARKVLDIGGGAGNMAHHLAQYGQVTGLDYHPRPLAVAVQRGLEVCQAVGDALPFGNDEFDLAALLDTVEHVENELGVFQECRRVLKPGGKLVITVPAFMWLWSYNDEINDHKRRYTTGELRQKLELCGLRVQRLTYTNFFLFPLIAGLRALRNERPDLDSPHLSHTQEVYQVEMEAIPEPANSVLHGVGWLEAELLQHTDLPFGVSILCVAEKPKR